jgi:hypothetical protein
MLWTTGRFWSFLTCWLPVGKHCGGRKVDIHVNQVRIQIWEGADLLKTVPQDNPDQEVRVKKRSTYHHDSNNLRSSGVKHQSM